MKEECEVASFVACACARMPPFFYTPERLFMKFIFLPVTVRHIGGSLSHHWYAGLLCDRSASR